MRILIAIGTRPEAIKMASLIKYFKEDTYFDLRVCNTGQHMELIQPILDLFNIEPEYNLSLMRSNSSISDLFGSILSSVTDVIKDFEPDIVFVHGDTATTAASSIASYFCKTQVAHIEAGLRTGNIYSPWPEEGNRKIVANLTNLHFSPTEKAKTNLVNEGVCESQIFVTGNTVIDSLFLALNILDENKNLKKILENRYNYIDDGKKLILVTGHRRENFGDGFLNICEALQELSLKNADAQIIYPVHLNPNVQKPVKEILSNNKNIHLIEPVGYLDFIYLMKKSYFILTDSGGIQEEAPSLGKPVLLMRDTTERPEAVEAGTVKMVGAIKESILHSSQELLDNQNLYNSMSKANNPFGDGNSCKTIINILKGKYNE